MSRVVVMTVHKAASTLLRTALTEIAQRSGAPYHCQDHGTLITHWELERDIAPIVAAQGLFGPLRSFAPVHELPDTKIILHLRDPRDVMVSLYYSFAYSHAAPPGTDVTADRARWQAMGIDAFITDDPVIWGPPAYRRSFGWQAFRDRYELYCDALLGRSSVELLRYEDLFVDFERWWAGFAPAFADYATNDQLERVRAIVEAEIAPPADENAMTHKRKMLPGDHREKLKPATIAFLNEKFERVLSALYPDRAA